MDFEWGERAERIRGEVRAFLAEHLTPEVEETMYRSGVAHDDAFARALGERHWISPVTPREGFEPLGVAEIHVLTEELTRADAPIYATETAAMVARVISSIGPEWMREQVVPAVHRGEVTIALGMTEPEAGSDVAAIQTRARQVDGGWIVDGQKMFTTNAHMTDYVFLLARTDPSSERHHGLTTFLVPTDRDGYETQAVFTLVGGADEHHVLRRPAPRGPLAHQRRRRRLAVAHVGPAGRALGTVRAAPRPHPPGGGALGGA